MCSDILCLGNGKYEWIIEDLLFVTKRKKMLFSPPFYFHSIHCYLRLVVLDDEVTLEFDIEGEGKLHVELGMNTGLSGVKEIRSGIIEKKIFTLEPLMSLLELKIYIRAEKLLNRTLTVYCKLSTVSGGEENLVLKDLETYQEEVKERNNARGTDIHESLTSDSTGSSHREIMLPNNECLKKLIQDLESLLSSDEDSDVILKVQGKEFPAHKNILRARSPVFKSMFSHSMLEKESGVANLDDCNPDTFPDFLKYLYTGNTKHISLKNVFDLYTVSDKYCIDELKEECSLFIRRNLSVETFCDAIILGLRHYEKDLIDAATDFFCRRAAEIVKTPKWQTFLRENPDAGNELFIKALSSK